MCYVNFCTQRAEKQNYAIRKHKIWKVCNIKRATEFENQTPASKKVNVVVSGDSMLNGINDRSL